MAGHSSAPSASAEETGDDQPRKKFSGKKLVLFVVLPLLLLILAGAGVFFSGILSPKKEEVKHEEPKPEEKESATPIFFDVPDMLINLNATGRRPTFLKIIISLQISRESDRSELEKIMPRVIDNFQVYLRELRLEDLRGSAGMYRLREELLTRVVAAAQPVRIKDVLFKEMLIQ
ncbi:MAG: flagellar basal body-associated FliL family protein [Rhodospirillaceae bacterium]